MLVPLPLVLMLALQVSAGPSQTAVPRQPADRIESLRRWVTAVELHRPGELDGPARTVLAFDHAAIEVIVRHLSALSKAIHEPNAAVFFARALLPTGGTPTGPRTGVLVFTAQEREGLRSLALELSARGDANRLLKRAAVLHADLAMLAPDYGVPSTALRRRPLLRTTVQVVDGKQIGLIDAVDHLQVARVILDEVRERPDRDPAPAKDPDVRLWYQATSAYLLAAGRLHFAHFDDAVALFPLEPDLLVAAGGARDMASVPGVHGALRRARGGFGTVLDLRSQDGELRQAESLYRRAVASDRGHAEALIRLGRVLGRRQRHADAAAVLRRAIPLTQEPALRFYAHMFLGRELDETGDLEGARAEYERAAAIAPEAQSVRLALSQLLMRSGNARAALETIGAVLSQDEQSLDPMWSYYYSVGREAPILMRRVYATMAPPR